LRCGPVRVRPASRELFVDGHSVSIERRAFDLLVHLMRHSDRVIDKDELLREVWHSRPVSESALPQAISRVRRALGGETDQWVLTVYGVGYRFAGTVEEAEAAGADHPAPTPAGPATPTHTTPTHITPTKTTPPLDNTSGNTAGMRWTAVAIALVTVLIVAWVSLKKPDDEILRVAVLPVQNDSGDTRLDWVSFGLLPLIDSTLADEGVQRVDVAGVLATLRRYPDADGAEAQARVLRLNGPVDRILVPRLTVAKAGYRLDLQSADPSDDPLDVTVEGGDIPVLAVAAGTSLSRTLAPQGTPGKRRRTRLTDDPFTNEALARGHDARYRSEWENAAKFFDTALAAAPDLLDARFQLALVKLQLGDWDAAEQLHRELLNAARDLEDRRMIAAVQQASGTLAWRRGDRDAAEQHYVEALEGFTVLGSTDKIAAVTVNLGILAATRGHFELAELRMLEALGHYEAAGARYNEARTRKNLGKLLADQGRLEEGAQELQRSLEMRQALDLPYEVALTLSDLADIDMAQGNWPQALAHYERALETAREFENPRFEAIASADLSTVLRRLGRIQEARELAAHAYRLATELNSASNQAYALLQQGRAEYDLGHWQRASELFEQARVIYAEIEQPLSKTLALIAGAEAMIEAGRLAAARDMLDEAARPLEGAALDRIEPGLARARARLALAQGDLAAALDAQRAAYRSAVAREALIERLDFGGELGMLLLESGTGADEQAALATELAPRAEASAAALEFLARYHQESDPDHAQELAARRRALLGDGWALEDW
jgi:DNA-binding winged helix-turn-helix (wHTH) protein/tetratricopeptide (TPR) repeat protein